MTHDGAALVIKRFLELSNTQRLSAKTLNGLAMYLKIDEPSTVKIGQELVKLDYVKINGDKITFNNIEVVKNFIYMGTQIAM